MGQKPRSTCPLAAVLGTAKIDKAADRSRLNEQTGQLTKHSTPWAKQMSDDLKHFAEVEDFADAAEDNGDNLLKIFTGETAEKFIDTDFSVLRAMNLQKKHRPQNNSGTEDSEDVDKENWVTCGMESKDGTPFLAQFADQKAKLFHIRRCH